MYSCQGRATSASVSESFLGRKLPRWTRSREMQKAEMRKESAFPANAHWYPNLLTLAPARNVPRVRVVHCVVWVSELAACNSSLFAMVGRIDDLPLVKKGEANMSSPLST